MTFDTKGFTVDADITELYTNRDRGTPYRLAMNDHIPLHSILTYQKAVVLGEPGSGKTTLFKHLLLDICNGYVCSGCIPIFVKLVDIPSFELGCISMFLQKNINYISVSLSMHLKVGMLSFSWMGLMKFIKISKLLLQMKYQGLPHIKIGFIYHVVVLYFHVQYYQVILLFLSVWDLILCNVRDLFEIGFLMSQSFLSEYVRKYLRT